MKKSIPLTALLGAAPMAALLGAGTMIATTDASAAPVAATLIDARAFANQGAATGSEWNLSLSTATWTFDSVTGEAAITGGTSYAELFAPNVFAHTMNGVTLGNFVPTLGTWSCQEGTFGGAVGASLCGNYNFGSNKKNQSTYTPTAQGATVTILGDDLAIPGAPQTLQNSYSNMTTTSLGGGQYRLSNAGQVACVLPTNPGPCSGYSFTFQTEVAVVPVPAAVWLFGSALGLMGVMRRRKSA